MIYTECYQMNNFNLLHIIMEHLIFTVVVWIWVFFASIIVLILLWLVVVAFFPYFRSFYEFGRENLAMYSSLSRIYKYNKYRHSEAVRYAFKDFIDELEEKYWPNRETKSEK